MLEKIFPSLSRDTGGLVEEPSVHVGTPENVIALPAQPRVLTGAAARSSESARIRNYLAADEKERDDETFFPVNARQQRRDEKARRRRQLKKTRRNFVRSELAKESAANDLANLFAIIDHAVPASLAMWFRAKDAIEARVRYLQENSPTEIHRDDVLRQLRAVAETAPIALPSKTKQIAELAARTDLATGHPVVG